MTRALRAAPIPAPEMSVYRGQCVALLRRYFSMSVEVGRLPAILGRECFRARTCDYHVHSFENMVVFVIDVERCLDRLHSFDKELIARIILQEYTKEEAARLLHCGVRTIERRLPDTLDFLTGVFIGNGLLDTGEQCCDDTAVESCPASYPTRVPRRPHAATANHPARVANPARSHFENSPVKPPFSINSPQRAVTQENIMSPDVAGLPPQMCYTGFVS